MFYRNEVYAYSCSSSDYATARDVAVEMSGRLSEVCLAHAMMGMGHARRAESVLGKVEGRGEGDADTTSYLAELEIMKEGGGDLGKALELARGAKRRLDEEGGDEGSKVR